MIDISKILSISSVTLAFDVMLAIEALSLPDVHNLWPFILGSKATKNLFVGCIKI
jgi:hypothetical protein